MDATLLRNIPMFSGLTDGELAGWAASPRFAGTSWITIVLIGTQDRLHVVRSGRSSSATRRWDESRLVEMGPGSCWRIRS